MAQHHTVYCSQDSENINKPINQSFRDFIQKSVKGIIQRCSRCYGFANSMRFFELHQDYKEHPNDIVYVTYYTYRKEQHSFEVHFDQKAKSVSKIYHVI